MPDAATSEKTTMKACFRFLLVLGLVLSLGCATSLVVSDTNQRLPANAPVYVAVDADGGSGDRIHEGSGLLAAVAVAKALEPYTSSRLMGLNRESRDEALASARRANAAYLFVPRIVSWEDRTTLSARPQSAELVVSVIEVESGNNVVSAQIAGKSQAFLSTGTPQEQLATPLSDWADQLFVK